MFHALFKSSNRNEKIFKRIRERLVGLVTFSKKLAWRIGFASSFPLVMRDPLRRECFQITVTYSYF